ncbi:DMT family transporter [Brevibacillus sp. B_LB10_24]|uniref:DMT family transporter n=1 Tax=Brevibacillus sp. B_LB10_24 TaxID=3380645 RepID=UPI0038BB280C
MKPNTDVSAASNAKKGKEGLGMFYGLLGVVGFSLSLPTTRVAVEYFNPTVTGLGRALVAAVLAGLVLWIRRERIPNWTQIKSLAIVAFGVVIGFPFFSSWAMERVPSSHGAVVIAMLPIATAAVAALRGGERPSIGFWLASAAASATVVFYAFSAGFGRLQVADLALIGAVISAAIGYAEGGRLARELGGWQVISWSLVISAPFLIWPVASSLSEKILLATPAAWLSFAYVCLISQYFAFFAWYGGLALGGVAKVSQVQYLQPFMTIMASAFLLGEIVSSQTIGTAVIVVILVALGRKAAVRQVPKREIPRADIHR